MANPHSLAVRDSECPRVAGMSGGPSSASGRQPSRASSITRPSNLPTWGRPDRGMQQFPPGHPFVPGRPNPAQYWDSPLGFKDCKSATVLGKWLSQVPNTQNQPIPEIPPPCGPAPPASFCAHTKTSRLHLPWSPTTSQLLCHTRYLKPWCSSAPACQRDSPCAMSASSPKSELGCYSPHCSLLQCPLDREA